jgi:hypothetical protein
MSFHFYDRGGAFTPPGKTAMVSTGGTGGAAMPVWPLLVPGVAAAVFTSRGAWRKGPSRARVTVRGVAAGLPGILFAAAVGLWVGSYWIGCEWERNGTSSDARQVAQSSATFTLATGHARVSAFSSHGNRHPNGRAEPAVSYDTRFDARPRSVSGLRVEVNPRASLLGFSHASTANTRADGTAVARHRIVIVPLWALPLGVLPLTVWPVMGMYRRRRVAKRRAAGRCVGCGYDLRGSSERCPECGAAIEAPAVAGG